MGIYWPEDRVDDVFGAAYPPENASATSKLFGEIMNNGE